MKYFVLFLTAIYSIANAGQRDVDISGMKFSMNINEARNAMLNAMPGCILGKQNRDISGPWQIQFTAIGCKRMDKTKFEYMAALFYKNGAMLAMRKYVNYRGEYRPHTKSVIDVLYKKFGSFSLKENEANVYKTIAHYTNGKKVELAPGGSSLESGYLSFPEHTDYDMQKEIQVSADKFRPEHPNIEITYKIHIGRSSRTSIDPKEIYIDLASVVDVEATDVQLVKKITEEYDAQKEKIKSDELNRLDTKARKIKPDF